MECNCSFCADCLRDFLYNKSIANIPQSILAKQQAQQRELTESTDPDAEWPHDAAGGAPSTRDGRGGSVGSSLGVKKKRNYDADKKIANKLQAMLPCPECGNPNAALNVYMLDSGTVIKGKVEDITNTTCASAGTAQWRCRLCRWETLVPYKWPHTSIFHLRSSSCPRRIGSFL